MAVGCGAALVVIGAMGVGPLSAQVSFTPFFASYYPVGKLGETTVSGVPIEAVQNQGLGFGANIGYMFSDVLGVELGGLYVFSGAYVRSCDASIAPFCLTTTPDSLKGSIIFGQLALRFRPRNSNFFVLIGPAVVNRGGDAWSGYTGSEKMAFGGVLGLGVIARVAPKFALEIEVEAYGYSFDPDGSSSTTLEAKFRPDVVLKVGVPIPSR
jgi:hypothetical protein